MALGSSALPFTAPEEFSFAPLIQINRACRGRVNLSPSRARVADGSHFRKGPNMDRIADNRNVLAVGLLAGLSGGAAEVAWVSLYSNATETSGMIVAQQVTASVVPAAAGLPAAPLLGIAIHMLLSVVLGLAFAVTIWRLAAPRLGAAAFLATAAFSLALVWAINFFVVLPMLNPAFVTLMPYGITLASKVLFGITMGSVLLRTAPRRIPELPLPVYADRDLGTPRSRP